MNTRVCKICNESFIPKFGRQFYCKKEIKKICPVCGDEFIIHCQPDNPTTCPKPECKKKAGYIGSVSKKRKCKICGSEFTPTSSTQECCNKPVERICECCGRTFIIKCTTQEYNRQTCSEECKNKLASQHRQETYMQATRVCELCGEEFHPKSNTQRVCERDHFRVCVVCGKQFKLNYRSDIGQSDLRVTCSDECFRKRLSENSAFSRPEVKEKIAQTMIDRYGVANPSSNPQIFAKQKATMIERYGVEFMMQSEEGKKKIIETNRQRYGVDWALQNEDIKKKSVSTNLEKYGVENVMQDPDTIVRMQDNYERKTGYRTPAHNPNVIAKTKATNLEKYGAENVWGSAEVREKSKETMRVKYGTDIPMHNDEIRTKMEKTNLERYGSRWYISSKEGQEKAEKRMEELYVKKRYSQSVDWKRRMLAKCTNIDEWMKFSESPEKYIQDHYSTKPTYREIARDTGVLTSTVNEVLVRNGLTHLVKYSFSYMEEEIREFLDQIGITYKGHERRLIYPYEVDIYVPEFNLGIECNPTSTHNSSIPYMNRDDIKVTPPSYHKMKTDMCEEKGISLLHIFGHDWTHSKDIILSMIKNRVRQSDNVIYARKCKVVEIDGATSIKFLNENHRQGAANSPVRLGLVYNDELVSLMTFGKMRGTIGTGKENLDDCWELVRFCSLLNTSVVGGASKLLKAFIKEFNPERIRSFSDRAHTSGNLYPTLGFKEIRRSDPGYVWVDVAEDRAYHRVNAQKQNLKKFLNDDLIDLTKTEREIMIEHGFVQVFDSGTITWEWNSKGGSK